MTQRDYQFHQFLTQTYAPLHPFIKQRFRGLGVFMSDSPFTRKFLYTFWDVDGDSEQSRTTADDHLQALLDAGFIEKMGDDRYCIYGTLVNFAQSLLKQQSPSEYEQAYGRYVGLMINLVRLLRSMSIKEWRNLLMSDVEQVIAFGDKLVAEWRKGDLSIQLQEIIMQFMDDVVMFVVMDRSLKRLAWLEMALDVAQKSHDVSRYGFFLDRISLYHYLQQAYDTALSYLDGALTLHQTYPDIYLQAETHARMGLVYAAKRDFERAKAHYQEALWRFRDLKNAHKVLNVLISLSQACFFDSDFQTFREVNAEIIALYYASGDKPALANHLNLMGRSYLDDEKSPAVPYLSAAIALYRELGDTHRELETLQYLTDLFHQLPPTMEAMPYYKRLLELIRQTGGAPKDQVEALYSIADLHLNFHQYAQSQASFEEALAVMIRSNETHLRRNVLGMLAATCAAQQKYDQAAYYLEIVLKEYRLINDNNANAQANRMLGMCYIELEQYERARLYLDAAITYLVRAELQDEADETLESLAQVILAQMNVRYRKASADAQAGALDRAIEQIQRLLDDQLPHSLGKHPEVAAKRAYYQSKRDRWRRMRFWRRLLRRKA